MFFVQSDLCGVGGMHQEQICSTLSWYDHPRHDTVFVVLDDTLPGMEGMVIAQIQLLFSFDYRDINITMVHLSTGLSVKTTNLIQTPGCGSFPWRSGTGCQQLNSLR
jgi:hypothetical protein